MKITVDFCASDALADAVRAASWEAIPYDPAADGEDHYARGRHEIGTWESLEKFVSQAEYVTIEFDTDAGTATVVPRRL